MQLSKFRKFISYRLMLVIDILECNWTSAMNLHKWSSVVERWHSAALKLLPRVTFLYCSLWLVGLSHTIIMLTSFHRKYNTDFLSIIISYSDFCLYHVLVEKIKNLFGKIEIAVFGLIRRTRQKWKRMFEVNPL